MTATTAARRMPSAMPIVRSFAFDLS